MFFCGEKEVPWQNVSSILPENSSEKLVHCMGMIIKHEGKGNYIIKPKEGGDVSPIISSLLRRKLLSPSPSSPFLSQILTELIDINSLGNLKLMLHITDSNKNIP